MDQIVMEIEQNQAPVPSIKVDSSLEEAKIIYNLPFNDLLFRAQQVHRRHFDANAIQMSRLLSIKTGGCPEDCGYCSQSARNPTGLKASKLMEVERVLAEARKAKEGGGDALLHGGGVAQP
ncbi:biotin synthase-like enzyme [Agrobacterium sp. SORGH_AS 745]|nr:biotin synthase-like enzyme [Agrobacterium sp. SORGH_AS_0745]